MKHGHCIKGPSYEKGYNKLDMKRVTKMQYRMPNVRSLEPATLMYKYSKVVKD